MRARPWSSLALLSALTLSGCAELLSQLRASEGAAGPRAPTPPRVTVSRVRLTRAPTNEQLAAHLCGRVAPPPVCTLLGPTPSREELQFQFTADLEFENTNQVPLPLVEVLAGFTVFPQATGERNLGAACLTLCEDPARCAPAADACRSDARDIRTLDDFAGAAANFLTAVATGQQRLENLRIRTLAPGARTRTSIHLQLDPDALLRVIEHGAERVVAQVQRGQPARFEIPWRFEGTGWLRVEGFGRFAASIPPVTGTWEIPSPQGAPQAPPLGLPRLF
jgi:hypothetical protein